MPSAWSQQMNGYGKKANGFHGGDGESFKNKLANEKLDSMEQEYNNGNSGRKQTQQIEAEVFHDTNAMGAHADSRRANQDDEPIVIFDTQSNTSIAQTAKDQFAAALLRLQAGLDDSSARLNAIENRIDDLVTKQQRQVRSGQEAAAKKQASWSSFISNGQLNTLLYLSWPVLVFVAMRALEKRALLKKLA